MKKNIVVLPGDGIGPEVTDQAVKVLKAASARFDLDFDFQYASFGAEAIFTTGRPLPEETLEACSKANAVLLGAIGHPDFDNNPKATVRPEQGLLQLRKSLGLYANIRPVSSYKCLYDAAPLKPELLDKVDMVIYRELTGGSYFGKKTREDDGNTATDTCTYTRAEIERIAVLAFESAKNRKHKVTLVDKANVLETSRLWREVVSVIAEGYPEIVLETMYVDNAAMQLMLRPSQFDVILTENMFGDILSDEASVLTGSLGMLPSASLGASSALFEPSHGSYPQAAGKDIANPVATILSAALMLEHFGLQAAAACVREAVGWAIGEGIGTVDIFPSNPTSCSGVGELIALRVEEGEAFLPNKKNMFSSLML